MWSTADLPNPASDNGFFTFLESISLLIAAILIQNGYTELLAQDEVSENAAQLINKVNDFLENYFSPDSKIIQFLDSIDDYAGCFLEALSSLPLLFRKNVNDINKNQALLDKLGAKDEWIPQQFKCPITLEIIDGIPLYAPPTNARFSNALRKWLNDSSSTNPLSGETLKLTEIKRDFVLFVKIQIFIFFLKENCIILQALPEDIVKSKTHKLAHALDQYFSAFESQETKLNLLYLTYQALKLIKVKAKENHLSYINHRFFYHGQPQHVHIQALDTKRLSLI